jgi:hypothetical protein
MEARGRLAAGMHSLSTRVPCCLRSDHLNLNLRPSCRLKAILPGKKSLLRRLPLEYTINRSNCTRKRTRTHHQSLSKLLLR